MTDPVPLTSGDAEPGDPQVSVIVPLFNGEAFIEETVRRVLAQSYRSLEVIVVDDGSTDAGSAVVRGIDDPRVAVLARPHSGIAATRNAGLARAHPASRYVMFLDQDDVLAPDLLDGLVRILAVRDDAVGAYAIADFIDVDGEPMGDGMFAAAMRRRRRLEGRALVAVDPAADVRWPELFLANHVYPPSAALLRTRAVRAAGAFDTSYRVADDWDLMLRLLRQGPLVPWDAVRVGYRRHDANASSNTSRNVRETRAVWANTYHSPENARADRALLRRWWRSHQHASARRKFSEARSLMRHHPFRAALRGVDAAGHLLLERPPRMWRTRNAG